MPIRIYQDFVFQYHGVVLGTVYQDRVLDARAARL